MLNDETKLIIKTELNELVNRIKSAPTGRDSEQVIMNLELLLKGQDAIEYEVIKIFTKDLTHHQLIELIVKLGVRNALDIIKPLALIEGIML